MNQTCRTLLEKQGRTHKWCTLMDPHTWPCKSRTTSTNIHSATMWGYGMLSGGPTWGDERERNVAREGQGYPCYQHDVMMMMMMRKILTTHIREKNLLLTCISCKFFWRPKRMLHGNKRNKGPDIYIFLWDIVLIPELSNRFFVWSQPVGWPSLKAGHRE